MGTAVELDSVAIQYAKYAGTAGISACLPYIVDRVARVVHANYGLVPVLAEPPLGVRPDFPAALQALFRPTNGSGLGRQA